MQGLQAGVWALGKMAVVSHSSAGRLYGFDRFEDAELEFTVGRSQRGRHLPPALGATVHTAIAHPRGDLRRVHGLPVTSPERTIVDLARDGAQQALLEAAIDSSIRLRLTSLDHIIDRLEKSKGSSRWGVAQLDSLVLTSGGHSVLERAFLRLLRRSGMPMPRPQVVHRINGRHVGRVDFLFEEQAVVVEVSGGRGHSTASERAKDAKRRNGLQQMGRTVLEFTYEDVLTRESYVLDTLKAAGVSRI
jgi:very-short-patch-repair endonuclease